MIQRTTVTDLATIFRVAPRVATWLLKKDPGRISTYAETIRNRNGCPLYCMSAGIACNSCKDRPEA